MKEREKKIFYFSKNSIVFDRSFDISMFFREKIGTKGKWIENKIRTKMTDEKRGKPRRKKRF